MNTTMGELRLLSRFDGIFNNAQLSKTNPTVASGVRLGIGVRVAVGVIVGVSVAVGEGVGVSLGGIAVGVAVSVTVAVAVTVGRAVSVGSLTAVWHAAVNKIKPKNNSRSCIFIIQHPASRILGSLGYHDTN